MNCNEPQTSNATTRALLRVVDQSAAGPVASWAPSLRAAASLLFGSGFPLALAVGADASSALTLYNDAFIPFLGSKHPVAMGQRMRDVWPEIWDFLGWALRHVWQSGCPVTGKGLVLRVERSGQLEEIQASLSFTAIQDDAGRVCGALIFTMETTAQVIGERRERTLRAIAASLSEKRTEADLCRSIEAALATDFKDLPFTLLYLVDAEGKTAVLRARTGLQAGARGSPSVVELGGPDAAGPWQLARVVSGSAAQLVTPVELGSSDLVLQPDPPRAALVVPVLCATRDRPMGALVAGIHPLRPLDASYRGFVRHVAREIGATITSVRAVQKCRRRAADENEQLQRRVVQMQKLESVGLLAGGVAHDFNNLLTVILAGASLARLSMAGTRGEAELDTIVEAARRASDLTGQLLAMSRSQPLELKLLDINERLRKLVAMVRRVLPENIEIRLVQGARLPAVEADASQLDQVLLNLCINARDAMPAGGRLTIESEQVLIHGEHAKFHPWAKAGRHVLIAVTDTGTGMAPEVADRVFEPFFTTKKEGSGTGLGLAVSFGIVRQHGGMLDCHSAVGRGTTFKLYLPAHQRAPSELGATSARRFAGGSERVLVAEDDAAVRRAMGRMLERAGYTAVLVEDGAMACERAGCEPFDLVILDVVMPVMGGPEALQRIRAILPEARFLVSSGYTAGLDASTLAEGGAVTLLPKPYEVDGFLRAVRQALDAGRG